MTRHQGMALGFCAIMLGGSYLLALASPQQGWLIGWTAGIGYGLAWMWAFGRRA